MNQVMKLAFYESLSVKTTFIDKSIVHCRGHSDSLWHGEAQLKHPLHYEVENES